MLKKPITYSSFDGEQTYTDIFYFNLTEAEIMKMEMAKNGGLEAAITEMIRTKNGADILATYEDLILRSYGIRSEDGKRFIKSKELSEEFSQTDAFSKLFMELVTDANAAAAFINGIIPPEVASKIDQDELERKKQSLLAEVNN